jgi:hypothetical protein
MFFVAAVEITTAACGDATLAANAVAAHSANSHARRARTKSLSFMSASSRLSGAVTEERTASKAILMQDQVSVDDSEAGPATALLRLPARSEEQLHQQP